MTPAKVKNSAKTAHNSLKRKLRTSFHAFLRMRQASFPGSTPRPVSYTHLDVYKRQVLTESAAQKEEAVEQLDLFSLSPTSQEKRAEEEKKLVRERKRQEAMLAIKRKYGKNAILKGMNLQEGATAKDRNGKIGGHKA